MYKSPAVKNSTCPVLFSTSLDLGNEDHSFSFKEEFVFDDPPF